MSVNSDWERLATVINILSANDIVEVSLWGEQAMKMHGIPTLAMRDDLILRDEDLDRAKDTLLKQGWEVGTGPMTIRAGFWLPGWREVADVGRRLRYPSSYEGLEEHELFILPQSFVGLGTLQRSSLISHPSSHLPHPSAVALARSIAVVEAQTTDHFASLMDVWGGYFLIYKVLGEDDLRELIKTHHEFWQSKINKKD